MLVTGRPWPVSVTLFLDYLRSLHEDGRGHSAITRAAHAFTCLERVGGVSHAEQLSASPLIKTALNEYALKGGDAVFSPVRKAPQMPLGLIASFEAFVVDD